MPPGTMPLSRSTTSLGSTMAGPGRPQINPRFPVRKGVPLPMHHRDHVLQQWTNTVASFDGLELSKVGGNLYMYLIRKLQFALMCTKKKGPAAYHFLGRSIREIGFGVLMSTGQHDQEFPMSWNGDELYWPCIYVKGEPIEGRVGSYCPGLAWNSIGANCSLWSSGLTPLDLTIGAGPSATLEPLKPPSSL